MLKRVLYVAHENTKGGATHSLINILDNLPSDIQPYVLIPKILSLRIFFSKEYKSLVNSGTLKQELKKRKIPFFEAYYFFDNIKAEQNIIRKIFYSLIRKRELRNIKKKISNEGIQIIHSNSSVIKFGADLSNISSIKHVWHIREDVRDMFNVSVNEQKVYLQNIIENSDNVVFVARKLKIDFQRAVKSIYGSKYDNEISKFITIYNGIPLTNSYKIKRETRNNTFNIYCFGTVYNIKGQEDLIELAKKMKEECITNFSVKLVGTRKQEYYEYLLNLISKYQLDGVVKFIDYTNDVDSLRNDANVEVVCSRNEAFGRVAVEAMNFGNPLIVTCVGGLDEIVEHEKSGLKYIPGDIEGLYKNIQLIMNNKVDIEEMIKNEKDRSKRFDIRECVSNITKLYQRRDLS